MVIITGGSSKKQLTDYRFTSWKTTIDRLPCDKCSSNGFIMNSYIYLACKYLTTQVFIWFYFSTLLFPRQWSHFNPNLTFLTSNSDSSDPFYLFFQLISKDQKSFFKAVFDILGSHEFMNQSCPSDFELIKYLWYQNVEFSAILLLDTSAGSWKFHKNLKF